MTFVNRVSGFCKYIFVNAVRIPTQIVIVSHTLVTSG